MVFEDYNKYCLSKKGVEASYPFKGEAVWMKVMGKMFSMANVQPLQMGDKLVEPFHFINVKCDPNTALELRASHHAIIPAWHQSKVHWNTIFIDGSLPDDFIYQQIDHSYSLVVNSLSKKEKMELHQL